MSSLRLRPMTEDDLPAKVRWANDPRVNEWIGFAERINLEGTKRWFKGQQANPDLLLYTLDCEGVAIGCALAFELSSKLGLCSQEDPSRVRAHLKAMGMKTDLADIPGDLPGAEALLDLMGQDKKVVAGQLRFILARGIGEAFVTGDVPPDAVLDVLRSAGA